MAESQSLIGQTVSHYRILETVLLSKTPNGSNLTLDRQGLAIAGVKP